MRLPGLALLLAALAASPALAASKKAKSSSSSKSSKRYGVLATGPSAAVAGKAALSAVKGVTVPDNRLQEEAQKYGVALGTDPAYQALALGMKLDAVVRVTTIDKGTARRRWRELVVRAFRDFENQGKAMCRLSCVQ